MGPVRASIIYKAQCISLKKENCLYGFEAVMGLRLFVQQMKLSALKRGGDFLTVNDPLRNIKLCLHLTVNTTLCLVWLMKNLSFSKQTVQ